MQRLSGYSHRRIRFANSPHRDCTVEDKKMKIFKNSLLISLVFAFVLSVNGQKDFSDPNVEYIFTLPNDTWKMTVKPSEVSPNVEFVYDTKNNGHLEIRKIRIEENTLYGDIIKQEELSLLLKPSYVAGREENFQGFLSGRVFNYEFLRSGETVSGRHYLLKADTRTIYVLRFTGFRDALRAIRAQTDSIARTFRLKSNA